METEGNTEESAVDPVVSVSPRNTRTSTPASSRFATPTASSRSRSTAIASSLTRPIPSYRYETIDDVHGVQEAPFRFPSANAVTQRGSPLSRRAVVSSLTSPPRRSGESRTAVGPARQTPHRTLSPAQRRAQKRQSVQELIDIADTASVVAVASAPFTALPTRRLTSPRVSTVGEAEVDGSDRGRHRHSVVVVPSDTMNQFDDALRTSPAAVETARGEGAQVVTDAVGFSLDAYRALHHRTFHSKSEELTFLRRDYVSLRKTLMLMYDENARLKSRLRERTEEVGQLQARVEVCELYHKGAESAGGSEADESGPGDGRRAGSRRVSPSRGGATGAKASSHAVPSRPTAAHASGGASPNPKRPPRTVSAERAAREKRTKVAEDGVPATAEEEEGEEATPASSSLWLHAAAQKAVRQLTASNKGPNAGANDLNTRRLIMELRRNLARRDTQLDALRLESADVAHARSTLEKAVEDAREALRTVTHDRNDLLRLVEEKDRAMDALAAEKSSQEKMLSECQQQITALESEVEKLRLLQGSVPAVTEGSDDGGAPADGLTDEQRLREEVREYRQRWQAAEDRIDQLLRAPRAEASDITSSPSPGREPLADDERQRLRRELQQQAEELHRLHRRLEREQEAAQFREGQQRQQAQDQARLHRTELAAVQEQLQVARAQLAREGQDRDALVRQLRQASDQDALSQVLQSQRDSLKQRLAEMGGQLNEVRGREKALQLEVHKTQHENLLLTKAKEVAEASLHRAQQDASLLQEEIELLRTRLGASEGKVYALEQMVAALQKRERRSEGTDCRPDGEAAVQPPRPSALDVDGQALASDLKGYAALMDLNAALSTRLEHLEESLATAQQALEEVRAQPSAAAAKTDEPVPAPAPPLSEDAARYRHCVTTELHALRHDLQLSQRAQQALLGQWQDLRQRHAELEEDNIILAEGTAVIHDELVQLLEEKAARDMAAGEAREAARREPPLPQKEVITKGVQVCMTDSEMACSGCPHACVPPPPPLAASPFTAPAVSRRVGRLRGTVEAARGLRIHDEDDDKNNNNEEEDEMVFALTEENKTLRRRVQRWRERVHTLQRALSEKEATLAHVRDELEACEDVIRLLDNGDNDSTCMSRRRGGLPLERALLQAATRKLHRRRSPRCRSSSSRRRLRRTEASLHSSSRSSTPRCPSSRGSQRNASRRRAGDVTSSSGTDDDDVCAPSTHSSSRHGRRHRRRRQPDSRRSARSTSSQRESSSSAHRDPVEVELYAVNCSARRDKHGVLKESWSAVPLTQAMTETKEEGRFRAANTRSTGANTAAGLKKGAVKATWRADGGDFAASTAADTAPPSARSTTSTTTTTSVTAVLLPRWMRASI